MGRPPPRSPLQLEGHRNDPPPPWSRGDAPPPPEGTATRGVGGCGWTCTLRAPAPQATCSRGGRGRRASPHQRAGAARRPSLGTAHGGAPDQYGGRAPNDPPMTIAHSGRAEGGFRSEVAPRGAVHGPLLIPPPRGGPGTPTERARRGGVRRRQEGGQGREPRAATQRGSREAAARPPPPPPQPARKPRGPRPPPPKAGGMVPPPPARGRSRSTARPPAPAAGSHRNRGERASPRQRARTPHRSRTVKAGGHEPEWYGGPRPP